MSLLLFNKKVNKIWDLLKRQIVFFLLYPFTNPQWPETIRGVLHSTLVLNEIWGRIFSQFENKLVSSLTKNTASELAQKDSFQDIFLLRHDLIVFQEFHNVLIIIFGSIQKPIIKPLRIFRRKLEFSVLLNDSLLFGVHRWSINWLPNLLTNGHKFYY